MKHFLLTLNKGVLFACTSMYFGTGWSMVLFSFPIASQLTPDNYYNQFVPQVTAATKFFTWMTMLMMLCAVIMIIEEWRSHLKWLPIGVLIGVIAATLLTTQYIFVYNKEMAGGITDAVRLKVVLDKWMSLNVVRVLLWTCQWLLMMIYFSLQLPGSPKIGKSS